MGLSFKALTSHQIRYALFGGAFGCLFPILGVGLYAFENDLSFFEVFFDPPKLLMIIYSAPFVLGLFASWSGKREDELRKLMAKSDEGAQKFLKNIVENIPNMIFVKEAKELRFVLFNKAGEQLLGVKNTDLMGKNDYDFFPKDQADFFTQKDRTVLEGKKLLDIPEEPIDTPSGKRWLHTRKIPILDNQGEPIFLLGISEDITEHRENSEKIRNQNQALLHSARLSSLGEMAGGIAHEINNPLAIIHGHAIRMEKFLSSGDFDHKTLNSSCQKIMTTVERISKIVHGLRKVARDGSEDPFESVSLEDLLEDTLGVCRERFRVHGVELQLEKPDEDFDIDCRSIQISQVLVNLLNNGFYVARSLKKDWVKLKVEKTEDEICFRVLDPGDGIPEADRKRLFQPFFTTKPVGIGTGLGLSTSRAIIHDHGGEITLDLSSSNTCFVVTIPVNHRRSEKVKVSA